MIGYILWYHDYSTNVPEIFLLVIWHFRKKEWELVEWYVNVYNIQKHQCSWWQPNKIWLICCQSKDFYYLRLNPNRSVFSLLKNSWFVLATEMLKSTIIDWYENRITKHNANGSFVCLFWQVIHWPPIPLTRAKKPQCDTKNLGWVKALYFLGILKQ